MKILVIDDDVHFGELTLRRLRRLGFEAKLLPGAQGAMEYLLRDDFALVLLDVNMPGIGGMEFMRMIRTSAPRSIKVILFSSFDNSELRKLAEEHGADDYLSKAASSREIELKVLSHTGLPSSNRWPESGIE